MNLEDRLRDVEILTEALLGALSAADDEACERLAAERGAALSLLAEEASRDHAGVASRRDRLQALREADQALRAAAETALAEVGAALQASRAHGNRRPSNVDPAPGPSGLDRRA